MSFLSSRSIEFDVERVNYTCQNWGENIDFQWGEEGGGWPNKKTKNQGDLLPKKKSVSRYWVQEPIL